MKTLKCLYCWNRAPSRASVVRIRRLCTPSSYTHGLTFSRASLAETMLKGTEKANMTLLLPCSRNCLCKLPISLLTWMRVTPCVTVMWLQCCPLIKRWYDWCEQLTESSCMPANPATSSPPHSPSFLFWLALSHSTLGTSLCFRLLGKEQKPDVNYDEGDNSRRLSLTICLPW